MPGIPSNRPYGILVAVLFVILAVVVFTRGDGPNQEARADTGVQTDAGAAVETATE